MRIAILTSSRKGTAAYCLQILLERTKAEIVQVIYSEKPVRNKAAHYRRKVRKIIKIGLLGAINGIRIRKWFAVRSVGGKIIEDIELTCRKNNISFEIVHGINSERVIDLLNACKPDLGLSLGNSYISSRVFTIPCYGMVNIHGEVLPQFQNAQSVIWQLYEGHSETGYTIHKVEKKIDAGEILKQERFSIVFKDTLRDTVNASCAEILRRSAMGLAEVVNSFGQYQSGRYEQRQGRSYTTPSFRQFLRIAGNFRKLKAQAGRRQP